jgi:erythromycin esterase
MSQNFKFPKWIKLLVCLSFLFGGCQPTLSVEKGQEYFQPISSLSIPENVNIVGLGEATHGNAEFVQIRLDVLKELVQKYDYRTIAIEGDFGGSQVVNEYVLNGTGTAAEAVRQIGFAIYKTQEMVDLVEWIYQYNQSAAQDKKIHFYGFDMQRYDHSIAGLLAFMERVDADKADAYRTGLSDLNDETVFNQSREKIQGGLQAIETILAEMEQEKEQYIAATSPAEFDLAYQFATCIQENATLRGTDVSYTETRDRYMAEKVAWIVSFEQNQGRKGILLAGHDGHIEKSAAAAMYRSMGSRLQETFGDQYFAIGTDFYESTFNCKESGSGERKQFSVKNGNKLNSAFRNSGMDIAYLDIQTALENPALSKILTSNLWMSNIGDEFSGLYRFVKFFYALKMVPVEAYDAIIFVRSATPTTMLADQ